MLKTCIRLLVLVAITSGIYLFTRGPLTQPTSYNGDGIQVLTWIKASSEGAVHLWDKNSSRLGYPLGCEWNQFPQYHVPLIWLLGIVTQFSSLWTAANFAILLSVITSAVGFYIAARVMRVTVVWSMAFSVVWAFSAAHAWRGLGHVFLSYDYLVPMAIIICWFVATTEKLPRGAIPTLVCASLLFAIGDLYNGFMWVALLTFSGCVRALNKPRSANLVVWPAIAIALTALFFLVFHIREIKANNKLVSPVVYPQTELFGLKPMELFIPPSTHRVHDMSRLGAFYEEKAALKGEIGSAYMGVIGIICLVGVLINVRRKPLAVMMMLFIAFMAVVGGGNSLISLCSPLLRATSRWSIWILAIVLIVGAKSVSRRTRAWSDEAKNITAAILMMFAVYDQWTKPPHLSADPAIIQGDKEFASYVESICGKGAALVLPFEPWITLASENTRLFLWTDSLKLSSGAVVTEKWSQWYEDNVVKNINPVKLYAMGFRCIVFDLTRMRVQLPETIKRDVSLRWAAVPLPPPQNEPSSGK